MNKMLMYTFALSFVLAGCGSVDPSGDSLDPQEEGLEEETDFAEGEGETDGTSRGAKCGEGNSGTDRSNVVLHAHIPRLPE